MRQTMRTRNNKSMKNKTFVITITIDDNSDLTPEDIFDAVDAMIMADFGPDADAFFGSPDELIGGDEMVNLALLDLARRETSEFTDGEIKKLFTALTSDEESK